MSKIREAVSVVLVHEGQVFMIRRQNFLTAFPGYHAFPGGKVDKEDREVELKNIIFKEEVPGLQQALMREIKEELGYDLESGLLSKQVAKIQGLGMALTPDFNPYRFATYFFLVELNSRPDFNVDVNEAESYDWKRPADWISLYQSGDMLIVPPILNLLDIMINDITNSQKKSFDFVYNKETEVPCIESLMGFKQLMPLSNTLPPANRTNAFLFGDDGSPRILVDPSPQNEEELKKFIHTAKKLKFDAIFLTHHHPDHHEFTPQIARELNKPVWLGEVTKDLLDQKQGKYYLKGIDLRLTRHDDVLTQWLGSQVLVYDVPGHDRGQQALYPENLKWFIVGDLIQGIGTVVIGTQDGDMAEYFESLKKVIKLSPQTIFPSHGIGMGGTFRLEKTLEHRKEREQQVLQLAKQDTPEQLMLEKIYQGLDPRLAPFALENIKSHLLKLKNEKKIKDGNF